ncbi:MAG: GNAT family N-acetyltransferase [Candidatus Coatesbacteria bacterium]
MEIETERLLIREFRETDFLTTHEYGSDLETTRYTLFGPNEEKDTRDFLARVVAEQGSEARTGFDLAIELKAGSRHIGGITLWIRGKETGEIGYVIHKDYWGKGYVPEAARALVNHAFRTLKLHRVYARCHTDNAGSVRVMEKLGMRREGHLRKDLWMKGYWRDSYLYAILDEEWR